jgi:hypothetical protein
MTEPEDTAQDAELDPEPSTEEGTADASRGQGKKRVKRIRPPATRRQRKN